MTHTNRSWGIGSILATLTLAVFCTAASCSGPAETSDTEAATIYVSKIPGPTPYPPGRVPEWSEYRAGALESANRSAAPWLKGVSGATHPVVLFDPKDAPEIRRRLGRGMGPRIMGHLRREAEAGKPAESGLYCLLSDDDSYAKKAIANLIKTAAREPGSRWLDNGGQIYQVALGYDLLYNYMTADQRKTVRERLDRISQNMFLYKAMHREGNWLPHCSGSLAIAGYALQEENRYAESWILRGRHAMLQYLRHTFDPQGADTEALCRYFGMGIEKVLIQAAAERRQGRDFFTYRGGIFNRIAEFAAYMLVPYEHQSGRPIDWHYMWVPYDDSFATSSDPPAAFAAIAGLTGDRLSQWLFEATSTDSPNAYVGNPLLAAAFYNPDVPTEGPDESERVSTAKAYWGIDGDHIGDWSSGHVFLRTGFADSETVVFSAQCGDTGGWHGHADQSSFFLYAYGDRLVMDPAILGSYHEPLNEWMKGPEAHNIVLIDGQATPDYTEGNKRGWPERFMQGGEIDAFVNTPTLDLVSMDFAKGLALNPALGRAERAKRYVLFFRLPDRRAYVVIIDDVIMDNAAHRYEWLLQPDKNHKIVKRGPGHLAFAGVPTKGRGREFSGTVDLEIRMIEPRDPVHETRTFEGYGVDYLRVRSAEDRKRGLFFTVLFPRKKDAAMPKIEPIRSGTTIGARIGSDLVLFNTQRKATISAAGVESDGELVAVRVIDNQPADAIVLRGTTLTFEGRKLEFKKPAASK